MEMDQQQSWYISGNHTKQIRKILESSGLTKTLFRRRFVGDDVKVTCKYKTRRGHTRISLRATDAEHAIQIHTALDDYATNLQTSAQPRLQPA